MGKKRTMVGFLAFLAMLVLTLDGKTAVGSAFDGIEVCLKTVIPSLFPFFVLSNLITSIYMGSPIGFLRPIGRLCGIPAGMESILIPSFLGGYPVAAQTIAQNWKQGQIPKTEAERLLAFCNNAGPSFLFGMTACLFPHLGAAWLLWGIQILTALITASFFPSQYAYSGSIPKCPVSITKALKNAFSAMVSVCGWILLFRILIGFLQKWALWLLPLPAQVVVQGMLELANGCMGLFAVEDLRLRFLICSGLMSFGGGCVMMQISSAVAGLSMKSFFRGKCIQTGFSILFAAGAAYGKPLLFLVPMAVFLVNVRKKSSISAEAIV